MLNEEDATGRGRNHSTNDAKKRSEFDKPHRSCGVSSYDLYQMISTLFGTGREEEISKRCC
jgi:5-methylcytosine-specific restriction endonuclease McrBC regulatory subunit McrC